MPFGEEASGPLANKQPQAVPAPAEVADPVREEKVQALYAYYREIMEAAQQEYEHAFDVVDLGAESRLGRVLVTRYPFRARPDSKTVGMLVCSHTGLYHVVLPDWVTDERIISGFKQNGNILGAVEKCRERSPFAFEIWNPHVSYGDTRSSGITVRRLNPKNSEDEAVFVALSRNSEQRALEGEVSVEGEASVLQEDVEVEAVPDKSPADFVRGN